MKSPESSKVTCTLDMWVLFLIFDIEWVLNQKRPKLLILQWRHVVSNHWLSSFARYLVQANIKENVKS